MIMKKLKSIFIVIITLVAISACSKHNVDNFTPPTPEVTRAIALMTENYFRSIVSKHVNKVLSYKVFPQKVLGRKTYQNAKLVEEQMNYYKNNYNKTSPLIGYKISKILSLENNAIVTLKKPNKNLEIKIYFYWIRNGWLIVDDNIFGEEGLLSKENLKNEE